MVSAIFFLKKKNNNAFCTFIRTNNTLLLLGVITSMVTDRLHTWLLVGTTRGILTLYDLRFQIPLRSWLHPTKSRISAMMLNHDPRAESRQVIIASGKNELSIWDIVNLKCLEVYAIKSSDEKTAGIILEMYKVK